MNKPNCCPKCSATKGKYKGVCIFSHCSCHTTPATASVEGWETEFDLKYPRVVGHRFVEGRDGVKTFIRSQIARAREEGAAEMKRKVLEEIKQKVIGLQKNRNGSGYTVHWWVKYDEVIELLSTQE